MFLQQKVAWLNLGVALASITAFFALLSLIGPWRAMGAFGILGFAGTGGVLYVLARRGGRVVSDERDQTISLKAIAIAKSAVWVAFMVGLRLFGENGAIPVRGISMVVWWVFCGFLIIQSSATLIMYSRQ